MFNFAVFPLLETPRLRLREIVPADAAAIFAIRGDGDVTRYNSGAPYSDIAQARELITQMAQAYTAKAELRWGITRKEHDTVIGMCGFNYWDRYDHRASIGYDLAHAHWGQGIMPEALRAVLAFGFSTMGLNRIEAEVSVYNTASVRVLAKLGFVQEGIQREQYFEDGQYHDLLLFALLKRDYRPEQP